jgi:hypothetical protein
MWWTRRSEKRFTGWLESAALGFVEEPLAIILPVVNEGVWQWTQPIFMKMARPFTVDGVLGAADAKRTNLAIRGCIELECARVGVPAASASAVWSEISVNYTVGRIVWVPERF